MDLLDLLDHLDRLDRLGFMATHIDMVQLGEWATQD
jgi:hypothetical protein